MKSLQISPWWLLALSIWLTTATAGYSLAPSPKRRQRYQRRSLSYNDVSEESTLGEIESTVFRPGPKAGGQDAYGYENGPKCPHHRQRGRIRRRARSSGKAKNSKGLDPIPDYPYCKDDGDSANESSPTSSPRDNYCARIADGLGPTNYPDVSFAVNFYMILVGDTNTILDRIQQYLQKHVAPALAGCGSRRRRATESTAIKNVVFAAKEIPGGDVQCLFCTKVDVNATIFFSADDMSMFGEMLVRTLIDHCDGLRQLEGVEDTFDPCSTIQLTGPAFPYDSSEDDSAEGNERNGTDTGGGEERPSFGDCMQDDDCIFLNDGDIVGVCVDYECIQRPSTCQSHLDCKFMSHGIRIGLCLNRTCHQEVHCGQGLFDATDDGCRCFTGPVPSDTEGYCKDARGICTLARTWNNHSYVCPDGSFGTGHDDARSCNNDNNCSILDNDTMAYGCVHGFCKGRHLCGYGMFNASTEECICQGGPAPSKELGFCRDGHGVCTLERIWNGTLYECPLGSLGTGLDDGSHGNTIDEGNSTIDSGSEGESTVDLEGIPGWDGSPNDGNGTANNTEVDGMANATDVAGDDTSGIGEDNEDGDDDDEEDGGAVVGVQAPDTKDDNKVSAFGRIGITVAIALLFLLGLLVMRRHRSTMEESKHRELAHHVFDDETYLRDDVASSVPEGHSPSRLSLNNPDDLDSSGWKGVGDDEHVLGAKARLVSRSLRDVHKCSSGTCEVCEARRRGGLMFIPTLPGQVIFGPTQLEERNYTTQNTLTL